MEENKYEAALERAKSAIKECGDNVGRIKMIESIFPELGESEDEKRRKNCIHFLELQKTHHASTYEIEECIAWLESIKGFDKQLEQTTI